MNLVSDGAYSRISIRFFTRLVACTVASLFTMFGHVGVTQAHTVTVGFVSDGMSTLTVWYGGYHGGAGPEGDVTITSTVGPPFTQTLPVNLTTTTLPPGMTNNITATSCSGGSLSTPTIWQGVTFTGLPSGTYNVQLTGSFTINWQPCDASISSPASTFVFDTVAPVVTVSPNIIVNSDAGQSYATVTYPAATATDDIAVTSGPTLTTGLASGGQFPIGVTTVTYEASDALGNTGSASFTVTVIDNEAPALTVPANISVNTDPGQPTAVVTFTPTAADNSGVAPTIVSSPASGSAFPVGVTTVNVTATDSAGNSTAGSFTVTVSDNEPPVVTVPADITVGTDASQNYATVSYPTSAADNVGVTSGPNLIAGLASGSQFPLGTTTVTYEALDAAGNMGTASFTVTVQDNEDPVVTVPANIAVNNDAGQNGAVVTYAAASATDNVGVTSGPTLTAGLASGSLFPIGVTTVSYEALDAAGNTGAASFIVTVTDIVPPTLTVPADITVNVDSGQPTAVVSFTPTATDNSGVAPTIVSAPPSGSAFPIGMTTVTVTATDASGNPTVNTFVVTVIDNEPPALTVPADITVNVGPGQSTAMVNFTPTATDNSGVAPTIVSAPPSGSAFPIGMTTVTVTATDADGNQTVDTFTVTVLDAEPPVLTVPADITVSTDPGQPTAVVNFTPTATDNSGVAPTIVSAPPSGSAFPIGMTTVTVTATDADGNQTMDTFVVTVLDAEPPALTVPADITVNADPGQPTAVVNFTPTATDNSGVAPTIVSAPPSGSAFPIGMTTVMVTATDADGNQTVDTFTVTVLDAEPPVLTVPADITVSTDPGQPTAVVNFTPTATDNSGVAPTIVSAPPSGSAFPIGMTTVTVTATDADGNQTVDTFVVTVEDNEPPAFAATPDIPVSIDYGQTGAVVSFAPPVATDNAPGVTVAQIAGPAPGSVFPVGTTVITYEATDAAGNTVQTSFNVIVTVIPPGQVEFVVNGPDGTFGFASAEPEFTFSINVSGGTGSSGAILIRPGTYAYTFTVPAGFGIAAAGCTSPSGQIDSVAQSGTVTLASGQNYVCTINSVDSQADTTAVIQSFMQTRGQLILSHQPEERRRIERLKGRYSALGGVSAFGLAVPGSNKLPASVAISKEQVSVSYSLRRQNAEQNAAVQMPTRSEEISSSTERAFGAPGSGLASPGMTEDIASGGHQNSAKAAFPQEKTSGLASPVGGIEADPMEHRFDLWFEGHMARFENATGDGRFGILHAGADYLAARNLLIGMGLQVDFTSQEENAGQASIDGIGWMVGPYLTARLKPQLYLDARVAWGQSNNDISPFGTYTDSFETTRWLATAALYGDYDINQVNIRPELRVNYFTEESESYVDSLNVAIPEVEFSLGEIEFGPRFTWTTELGDGVVAEPFVEFEGIWTFASDGSFSDGSSTIIDRPEGLRGRIRSGVILPDIRGGYMEISGMLDGIGEPDYEVWSARAKLVVPFR
jgi:hypothetical protein